MTFPGMRNKVPKNPLLFAPEILSFAILNFHKHFTAADHPSQRSKKHGKGLADGGSQVFHTESLTENVCDG